jgi:hypothetical protein
MTAKWVQALLKGSVELSSSRSTFISGRFATPPTSTAAAPCGGLIAQYFEPRTGFQPFRHHSKATTAVRFQAALAASPAASPASPLAPAPYVSGGSLGAALDLGFSLNNVLNGIPGLTMQLGVAFKQQIPASPDVFRVDTKVEAFEGKTMQLTGIVRDGEGGEFAVGRTQTTPAARLHAGATQRCAQWGSIPVFDTKDEARLYARAACRPFQLSVSLPTSVAG